MNKFAKASELALIFLLCLISVTSADTNPAGHEVFIQDQTVQKILNSNLQSVVIPPLTLQNASITFNDGFQTGTVAFNSLAGTFALKPSSGWTFSYSNNLQYIATLTNVGSLTGNYKISYPEFIETGSFTTTFPNNSIQLTVTLKIVPDDVKPTVFNISYTNIGWNSPKYSFDYGTKGCYFFQVLNKFFLSSFTANVNAQIIAGLPQLFTGDLINKPQAFVQSLIAQSTPVGTTFDADYTFVKQSLPDIITGTTNFLGFKTDGTVYVFGEATAPDQTSKPIVFLGPETSGSIVHNFSKYFVYSAFFQAQRHTPLIYTVDKTTTGVDLALVVASAFTDLAAYKPADELQIIFTLLPLDAIHSFSTQEKQIILTKTFSITYTIKDNKNGAAWENAIIANAHLIANFSLNLSATTNAVTAQILNFTVSGSTAQTGGTVIEIKDANINSTVTKLITYSVTDFNAKLTGAVFSPLSITGAEISQSTLTTSTDLNSLYLTYNLG